jgi:DNA (cytosine-5)-methyltransferase 1
MRLGGLFSGVGGFELAWTQLGHEVAWVCEVDKKARLVLQERFPNVTIYNDVRDIDTSEVESVDVLTGGSPCQGFSIAGNRTGMNHAQSGLFEEYVRIMDGLAARGLKYAIWENVPGVLSIKNPDGERTFTHVIGALAGAGHPAPLNPKAKWNAGMVAGPDRTVAWRVLDSQHFGVAQRRRRVFACVAFGDSATDRAGRTLLAVTESMPGDSASGSKAGQETSRLSTEGAGGRGCEIGPSGGRFVKVSPTLDARCKDGPIRNQLAPAALDVPSVPQCVTTGTGRRIDAETETLVPQQPAVLVTMREGKDGGGKGPLVSEEQSLTLATGNGQTLFEPQAFDEMNFTTDSDTHHVLRAGTPQSTGAVTEYGVRRLTPVECERLQGFPDGWTDVPGMSDTARYKAMGNAVTVNTVRWILGRIPEVPNNVS